MYYPLLFAELSVFSKIRLRSCNILLSLQNVREVQNSIYSFLLPQHNDHENTLDTNSNSHDLLCHKKRVLNNNGTRLPWDSQ